MLWHCIVTPLIGLHSDAFLLYACSDPFSFTNTSTSISSRLRIGPGRNSAFEISTMLSKTCLWMASFLTNMGLCQLEVWLGWSLCSAYDGSAHRKNELSSINTVNLPLLSTGDYLEIGNLSDCISCLQTCHYKICLATGPSILGPLMTSPRKWLQYVFLPKTRNLSEDHLWYGCRFLDFFRKGLSIASCKNCFSW